MELSKYTHNLGLLCHKRAELSQGFAGARATLKRQIEATYNWLWRNNGHIHGPRVQEFARALTQTKTQTRSESKTLTEVHYTLQGRDLSKIDLGITSQKVTKVLNSLVVKLNSCITRLKLIQDELNTFRDETRLRPFLAQFNSDDLRDRVTHLLKSDPALISN